MSAVGASTSTAAVNGNNQIFIVSGSEGAAAENDSARQGAFKVRKFSCQDFPPVLYIFHCT